MEYIYSYQLLREKVVIRLDINHFMIIHGFLIEHKILLQWWFFLGVPTVRHFVIDCVALRDVHMKFVLPNSYVYWVLYKCFIVNSLQDLFTTLHLFLVLLILFRFYNIVFSSVCLLFKEI